MFAKRGKKAFKGPMLNAGLFGNERGAGMGSPAVGMNGGNNNKAGSEGRLNLGLRDLMSRKRGGTSDSATGNSAHRKSLILEEEEEDEDGGRNQAILEEGEGEDGDFEEVDEFSDVETNLGRGERVHSVVIYDEPKEQLREELKGLNISSENVDSKGTEANEKAVEAGDQQDGAAPQATMAGRWDDKVDAV